MKSKCLITEYRTQAISSAVPIDQWLNRTTQVPSFARTSDFLDWLLDEKAIYAANLSPLTMLQSGPGLSIFAEWSVSDFLTGAELGKDGMLRWNNYRLKLSARGNKLTVRRGNQYGVFIDLENLADSNWPGIVQVLRRAGIYALGHPVSAGGVASNLLAATIKMSTQKLPSDLLALAWQACKGGRMEALTLGSIDGYSYDISSAYPAAARNLPRCDHPDFCRWIESADYEPNAFYGVAVIDVDLPDWVAGPLAVRTAPAEINDDLELHFPSGRYQRVTVAKPDMDLLRELGIPFQIRRAWWGIIGAPVYPFRRLMNLLWDMRQADHSFAKAVSVACVGQLGSVIEVGDKWVARPWFAPVYFSHIYAEVRAQIFRKALECGLENVLAFCIDNLITSVPLTVGSPGMGAWREESQGSFFLPSDYFKDRPGSSIWRKSVSTTPDAMPGDSFRAEFDEYVSFPLTYYQPRLQMRLGGTVKEESQLPLGAAHRRMPAGVTRQDFLAGAIATWL